MSKNINYKPLVTIISPEVANCQDWYAITLSPPPERNLKHDFSMTLQNKLKPFNEWVTETEDTLGYLKYCDYVLWTEVSSTSRFHLHGVIKIRNLAKFYMFDVRWLLQFGGVCMNIMHDPMGWHLYCIKNSHEFIDSFQEYYVPFRFDNKVRPKAKSINGLERFFGI